MLPLSGVRVLDLTRLLPGPFATMVLADLGADVVKVEDPSGGDWLRHVPPLTGDASAAYHGLNRNKRSIALDLRRREGAAAFLALARRADAVVESFRPGVLDRLGIGWAALHRENPRLVLCSISGYGQDGPHALRAGHDIDYLAVAGVLAANGPPDRPLAPGVQVADVAGGSWPAAVGVLAALLGRVRSGEGAHVDVSMTEGALAMLALPLGIAWGRGAPLARGRELLDGGSACYGVYRTKDRRFVALGALEPKFFAAFCAAVGRPELAERQLAPQGAPNDEGGSAAAMDLAPQGAPRNEGGSAAAMDLAPQGAPNDEGGSATGGGRVGPRAELEAIFESRTRDEWAAFAAEHDVCLEPVLEGEEPRAHPQLRARGAFVEVPVGPEGLRVPAVASPVRIRGERAPLRPAPRLGEHAEEVLREAGLSVDEIAGLRAAGVLG